MKINDRANTLHGHVQVFVRNKKTGEKTLVIDGKPTLFAEHILTKEDFEQDKSEKLDVERLLLFLRKNKKANKTV